MSAPTLTAEQGHQAKLAHIRALIAKAKRWDLVFAGAGMLALSFGLLTLVALFADMLISAGHASTDFSSTSHRAGPPTPASFRPGSVRSWSCS